MIIEWVGCSGAGKSTLLEEVYNNLRSSGIDVRKPLEIFLGRTFAKIISNERLQNVLLDFLVLPWSLISTVKHWPFLKYCLGILSAEHFSFSRKILLLRSIFRKMGLYIFLKDYCNKRHPIIFDEGTIQIAHLLFAHEGLADVSKNDIKRFCELVPTPDLIIHIMAPESEVLARTLNRKDKPISETSPAALKNFIALGQKVFKYIEDLNPWSERTIKCFNPDKAFKNKNEEALNIMNQIVNFSPSLNK